MQNLLQILKDLRGLWRFRWQALGVTSAICVLGWFVVLAIPDQYEAMSRVYVDTRTPLRPLLQGLAVDQDVEAQLNMVRQALLGRPHLAKVAHQTGLDADATSAADRSAIVDRLSKDITIALEPPAVRDPRIPNTFYRITYVNEDRQKAMAVVDVLVNSFMEDTMGAKRTGAEDAQKFLVTQLRDYERRLADAEGKLAEFKKKNVGLVPGAEGDYFQRLQNEMREIKRAEAALSVATSRKAELERQLRGEAPFAASATASANVRNPAAGGTVPSDTTTRIQETQARLDELLLDFTEKHPDVIALRETLEQLKERQKAEAEAIRSGRATGGTAPTNPVYQNIQLQANQANVEIAALRGELADRQRTVEELRRLVNTVPEVEAQYARLTRDYDVTRTQYRSLLERLESAKLSEDAQQTGIVRFDMVDPPTAKMEPTFPPSRSLLLAAVLIVGIGAGGAVAWLMNMLQPVFADSRSVTELTGLNVLGSVSITWLERHNLIARRGALRFSGAAAGLFALFVAVVVVHEPGSRLLQRLLG